MSLGMIYNFDETAMTWKIGPKYSYGPKRFKGSMQRSSKGESDKDRADLLCTYERPGRVCSLFLRNKAQTISNCHYWHRLASRP